MLPKCVMFAQLPETLWKAKMARVYVQALPANTVAILADAQTRVLLMSSSVSTPSGGLSFPMWKDPSPSEFTDPPFRP